MNTPDGLKFFLYGKEVELRHDIPQFQNSAMDDNLSNKLVIDEK